MEMALTSGQVATLVPILMIPLVVMGGVLGLMVSSKTSLVDGRPEVQGAKTRAIAIWLGSLILILGAASFAHLLPSSYAAASYALLALAWFASTVLLARAVRQPVDPVARPRTPSPSIRTKVNALVVFLMVLAIGGVLVNVIASHSR